MADKMLSKLSRRFSQAEKSVNEYDLEIFKSSGTNERVIAYEYDKMVKTEN